MIKLLLICSGYNWYVVQLWNNLKRYYKNISISIMTMQRSKDEYEQSLFLEEGEYIYTSSNTLVSFSMGITIGKLPNFDVIQALWMEIPWGIFARSLRKKTKVLYVEVGGSDLFRESKNIALYMLQKSLIKRADIISSENNETREVFKRTYGQLGAGKPHSIVRFGVDVIDEIYKFDENENDRIIEKWSFPHDKIIVMCGHNGSAAHRHHEILDAIQHMPKDIIQKLYLIIPMTYGTPSIRYRHEVESKIKSFSEQYRFLDEYLSTSEMAEITRMTDIMIHVQDTDQLSSTMMAHMYDENIVIAGSWLPYGQIKEEGIRFWEVDNISELTGVLEEIIPNIDYYKEQCKGNREKVYRFSSWEYCIKDWYNVYETMLEKVEDK